jgi:hypothetical protein
MGSITVRDRLFAGSSKVSLPCATRVMSVVVVKGFVRDARLNGVREVAFTHASRFAHPKPSSHMIFPLCATATATPVAAPRVISSRILFRTGPKSRLLGRPAEEFTPPVLCVEAGRIRRIDANASVPKNCDGSYKSFTRSR